MTLLATQLSTTPAPYTVILPTVGTRSHRVFLGPVGGRPLHQLAPLRRAPALWSDDQVDRMAVAEVVAEHRSARRGALASLAILAALVVGSLLIGGVVHADPAPRRKAHHARVSKPSTDAFELTCINERTGPTGGIPVREAIKLCQGIVKHQVRITKLAQRAAAAIEACQAEVSLACEDTTERATDGGECSDATLRAQHAFDVCGSAN